jgi:hypothetical protein
MCETLNKHPACGVCKDVDFCRKPEAQHRREETNTVLNQIVGSPNNRQNLNDQGRSVPIKQS